MAIVLAILHYLLSILAKENQRKEAMDVDNVEGYRPPPEFEEDVKEPLIDLSLTNSTELWLLQLPYTQDSLADFGDGPWQS